MEDGSSADLVVKEAASRQQRRARLELKDSVACSVHEKRLHCVLATKDEPSAVCLVKRRLNLCRAVGNVGAAQNEGLGC